MTPWTQHCANIVDTLTHDSGLERKDIVIKKHKAEDDRH